MITLTSYIYHGETAIYGFPLYPRNDWDEKFTEPDWISSVSQLPSSLQSIKQPESLELSTKSIGLHVITSKLCSSLSLESKSVSPTSIGLEENCQYLTKNWCLQNYNLTLYQLLNVLREIQRSKNFAKSIFKKELIPKNCRRIIISLIQEGHDLDIFIRFKVNDIHSSPVDWIGNYLILALVSIKVKIEESLSILSTLGGAYSSLGEHYQHFAIKAGETSLKQIGLACLAGDPTVIARCSIYMVYSLCQRGLHIKAKRLMIKFIFPYINEMIVNKTCDNILRNMYKAAKFRIEFYYKT